MFEKISILIDEINDKTLSFLGIKIEKREEYAIDYLENVLDELKAIGINPKEFVNGRGHRKTMEQRQYQKLEEYKDRLKAYSKHIEVCGDQRNKSIYCES